MSRRKRIRMDSDGLDFRVDHGSVTLSLDWNLFEIIERLKAIDDSKN